MTHNPRDLVLTFGEKHKYIPQLKFITENQDDLKITKLTGGFVNYVYLVQSADGQNSVIIKYGEEQASCEQIQESVSLERQILEYNCMKLVCSVSPGSSPEPYVLDQELNIIAMEYLENMEVLGPALCKGEVDSCPAAHLGNVLGCFHFHTHRNAVSGEKWQEFRRTLVNKEIKDLYIQYRFNIFEDFKEGSIVDPPDLPQFMQFMADIKSRGIFQRIEKMFRQEDCLIHQDAHNQSVMFSKERAVLIDFEFGGLGHQSYTLGVLLGFFYMATKSTRNKRRNENGECAELTKKAMRDIVDAFLRAFGDSVHILGPEETFISEIAAFLGHTIFAYPLFNICDIWIQAERASRKMFVEQGYQLMSKYQTISDLDGIFSIIFP